MITKRVTDNCNFAANLPPRTEFGFFRPRRIVEFEGVIGYKSVKHVIQYSQYHVGCTLHILPHQPHIPIFIVIRIQAGAD